MLGIKRKVPKHKGIPVKKIDWKMVDENLEAGCYGAEIAASIGIHPDTLYLRCQKEKGMEFSAYAQEKKSSGDKLLKKAQFDKALGRNKEADNTMLIWLGKQRLNQKDSVSDVSVTPETVKSFEGLMNQISAVQVERNKQDSNDNNAEKS